MFYLITYFSYGYIASNVYGKGPLSKRGNLLPPTIWMQDVAQR